MQPEVGAHLALQKFGTWKFTNKSFPFFVGQEVAKMK